jgi:hypothetical protein
VAALHKTATSSVNKVLTLALLGSITQHNMPVMLESGLQMHRTHARHNPQPYADCMHGPHNCCLSAQARHHLLHQIPCRCCSRGAASYSAIL